MIKFRLIKQTISKKQKSKGKILKAFNIIIHLHIIVSSSSCSSNVGSCFLKCTRFDIFVLPAFPTKYAVAVGLTLLPLCMKKGRGYINIIVTPYLSKRLPQATYDAVSKGSSTANGFLSSYNFFKNSYFLLYGGFVIMMSYYGIIASESKNSTRFLPKYKSDSITLLHPCLRRTSPKTSVPQHGS